MHNHKYIWYNCQTCGKSKTYAAYTIHKRFFDCSTCGEFIYKSNAMSERFISHPTIESINKLESYALAWGMEGWN